MASSDALRTVHRAAACERSFPIAPDRQTGAKSLEGSREKAPIPAGHGVVRSQAALPAVRAFNWTAAGLSRVIPQPQQRCWSHSRHHAHTGQRQSFRSPLTKTSRPFSTENETCRMRTSAFITRPPPEHSALSAGCSMPRSYGKTYFGQNVFLRASPDRNNQGPPGRIRGRKPFRRSVGTVFPCRLH